MVKIAVHCAVLTIKDMYYVVFLRFSEGSKERKVTLTQFAGWNYYLADIVANSRALDMPQLYDCSLNTQYEWCAMYIVNDYTLYIHITSN